MLQGRSVKIFEPATDPILLRGTHTAETPPGPSGTVNIKSPYYYYFYYYYTGADWRMGRRRFSSVMKGSVLYDYCWR